MLMQLVTVLPPKSIGSRDCWRISNTILTSSIPHFNGADVLTSSKDKANLFAAKFATNSTLDDTLHSHPDFSSRTEEEVFSVRIIVWMVATQSVNLMLTRSGMLNCYTSCKHTVLAVLFFLSLNLFFKIGPLNMFWMVSPLYQRTAMLEYPRDRFWNTLFLMYTSGLPQGAIQELEFLQMILLLIPAYKYHRTLIGLR